MPTKAQLEQQKADLEAELEAVREEKAALEAARDPQSAHLIGNHYDDEQLAQRRAEAVERNGGIEPVGAVVGAEPFEKSMLQRGDNFAEGRMPWETHDPFGDTAREHTPQGHTPRFLSTAHIDRRGYRGWKPVEKDGKQVHVGGMILASMPKEVAAERNKHYQDLARRRTRQTIEMHQEAEDQSRAAGLGLRNNDNEISITRTRRMTEEPVSV